MNEFSVIDSPLAGTNLIEASAGTGKTYAISLIFLRLIVEKNFMIEDILVVTFTIPATMELRHRIRERLRDAVSVIDGLTVDDKTVPLLMNVYKGDSSMKQRVLTALKSFDQASVYTIHSFCQQMLVDNAFESGSLFKSEIVNDDALIEQGAADLCRRVLYNSSPAFVSYFMANCSEGELISLYKKRPLSAGLRIEPAEAGMDINSLDKSSSLVSEYYIALCDAWSREEETVTEILYKENFLNGNKYRKESRDSLIEQMNDYIAGEDPFAVFDKFVNYTSGKIKSSLNKGCEYPETEVFDICQKLYDTHEEYLQAGSSSLVAVKKMLFDYIDELILKSKSINSNRSFDDLIRDAHRGLNSVSGNSLAERVRSRYRAALIDEFQDTDNLQFDIFNTLFNNDKTILFLIGDPKQAIYRFRGADIFSYIKASQLMKNSYTLGYNWRSRHELIECVNALFARCSNPFVFDKIKFHTVKPGSEDQGVQFIKNGKPLPPFDVWLESGKPGAGDDTLLNRLSSEISHLVSRVDDNPYMIGDRRINPGDIAVLVRTGRQGAEVRDALARYNIPSVSRGMDNVFSTEEAVALYFIVSAIADPSNYHIVKGAAATAVMGGTAEILFGFHCESSNDKKMEILTSKFYDYRETWASGGFLNMITGFLEGESVASRLFSFNGGERMITNINHIAEILHAAEHENGFTPGELVTWFGNTIMSPPDDERFSMRLERDDDAVNIVTMHACKGLEFPVVYCPFLAHGGGRDDVLVYHDHADGDRPVMYLGNDIPDVVKEIKAEEDLAENVRLLYVALTRAKSACRVMLDPGRNFSRSAAYHIFIKSAGYDSVKYTREILAASVHELVESTGGKVSFTEAGIPEGKNYVAAEHSAENIRAREFQGEIMGAWKTHSYSAIAQSSSSHEKSEEKDFQSEYHARLERGKGIFSFESGARAGLCIHEIFEKADFTQVEPGHVEEICGGILAKYRFDSSLKGILAEMFINVVDTLLDESSGLKLAGIDANSRLSELEFNFPVDNLDSGKFRSLFTGAGLYCDKIYSRLESDRSETGGMMKGFIDLIFIHNGKYYIADWKSNHLGNTYDDYSSENIINEMEKHNYFLQYYIYTTALNRYLAHRIGSAYSYEEHFGGVYYFFVRGMNPGNSGRTGIFRDRPEKNVIEKLDNYFAGVKK